MLVIVILLAMLCLILLAIIYLLRQIIKLWVKLDTSKNEIDQLIKSYIEKCFEKFGYRPHIDEDKTLRNEY